VTDRPFSAGTRLDNLDRLDDRSYDLLVIGGGITGAGIALDAAARGLSAALIERGDLAEGTSSRSSSLVHGGLRYLSTGMVGLVRESAVERERLRRLAPHLVQPLSFVILASRWQLPALGAGLWAYDALSTFRGSRPRHLSAEAVARRLPGISSTRRGGWEFHDCKTDDARLVLQVARCAHRLGADVVTRAEAVELRHAGARVIGATVFDRVSGRTIEVSARSTVSAAGVWADRLRGLAGGLEPMLIPSKGTHLVFPADLLAINAAAVVPSGAGDHRGVFLLPYDDHVVVGTTDSLYDGPLDRPSVTAADCDYLCAAVNDAFGVDLSERAAVGAWAGLRPLVRPGGKLDADSEALSRRHVIIEEPEGFVTVTGGKLTTYRRMAEEVVGRLSSELGRGARSANPTRRLPLGLSGSVTAALARTEQACASAGVDPAFGRSLVTRHGDDAPSVVARAAEAGETGRLVPGLPYLKAEARWAIEQEMALSVDDILSRRTRVARLARDGGGPAIDHVSGLLVAVGGCSPEAAAAQAAAYRTALAAERGPVPLADSPDQGAGGRQATGGAQHQRLRS
jgi:glycerol-3-phosphate dehydrogenase